MVFNEYPSGQSKDNFAANIPGFGEVTQSQIDEANQLKDRCVKKIRDIASFRDSEEIADTIIAEILRFDTAKVFYDLTNEDRYLEEAAKSHLIARTLEDLLLERFGENKERCKNRQCNGCAVRKFLDSRPTKF